MRGSGTSTAESGSEEVDDAVSVQALRSYTSHPKLTRVREEVSS
jgi:hypothetical protein